MREDGTVPLGGMSSDALELMLRNVLKETAASGGNASINVPSVEGSESQPVSQAPSEFGPHSVAGSVVETSTSAVQRIGSTGSVSASVQTETGVRSRQRGVRKPGKYWQDHVKHVYDNPYS